MFDERFPESPMPWMPPPVAESRRALLPPLAVPPPAKAQPPDSWRWPQFLLISLGLAACLFGAYPLFMAATDSFIAEEANPDLAWIIEVNAAFLTYILVFVLSLALALLVGKGPRDFGFSLPYHSLPWLLAVTGLALLFIPIRMTLVIFLALLFDPGGLFRTNEEGGGIFSTDETALVAIAGLQLLIMIAIFAPVVEEFIFRGILQPWLRHQFGRAVSIVGSGVLFGLAHQETYLVISNIVMGLVIAAVYERTGSLWLAMWLHFVNNFTVVCLLVLALLLVAMAG